MSDIPVDKQRDIYIAEREYWKPHHDEQLLDARLRRRLRLIVAVLALFVSLILMFFMIDALYLSPVENTVAGSLLKPSTPADMWLKITLVSGTFLTFILVFGALIRGLFSADRNMEKHTSTNPRLNPVLKAMEMSQNNLD